MLLQHPRSYPRGLAEEHAPVEVRHAPTLPLRQPLPTEHARSTKPRHVPLARRGPIRSRRREIPNRQCQREPHSVQLVTVHGVEPPPKASRRLPRPAPNLPTFRSLLLHRPLPRTRGRDPVRQHGHPGHGNTPRRDMGQLIKRAAPRPALTQYQARDRSRRPYSHWGVGRFRGKGPSLCSLLLSTRFLYGPGFPGNPPRAGAFSRAPVLFCEHASTS